MSDKAETTKYIVYGSVAVVLLGFAYFGIISPVLQKLGFKKTKEEKEGDKDREKLGRKQVLSPLLWQKNKNRVTISSARANQLATQIHEGDGDFIDDESMGVGAIQSTGSLVNLSYVAHVFNAKYGQGLETYLEGSIVNYMEPRHWDTIDDYISKTKKY